MDCTAMPPFKRARIPSITSWQSLVIVLLAAFPFTHLDSRRSQVGLEFRLGIRSKNMNRIIWETQNTDHNHGIKSKYTAQDIPKNT